MNQDDGSKTGLKTETVDKHEGIEMGVPLNSFRISYQLSTSINGAFDLGIHCCLHV